jgi:hypothetical protein
MTSRACTTWGNKQTRRSVDHRGKQRRIRHMGSGGRCSVCRWVVASTKAHHHGDGSTLRPRRWVDGAPQRTGRRGVLDDGSTKLLGDGSTRLSRRRVGGAPQRRVDAASSAKLLGDESTRLPRRLPRRSSSETGRCGFLDSSGVPRRRIEEGHQRWVSAVCLLAHRGTHGGLMNQQWNLAHGSLRPPRGVRGESGRRIWKSGGGSGTMEKELGGFGCWRLVR